VLVAFESTTGKRLWSKAFTLLQVSRGSPTAANDRWDTMPFADTSIALANGLLYFVRWPKSSDLPLLNCYCYTML
jgi:hypothetical protein